jgi:hypothetical protein
MQLKSFGMPRQPYVGDFLARRGIDQMCADTWRWQQWAAANLR